MPATISIPFTASSMISFWFTLFAIVTFNAFALADLPHGNCLGDPVAISRSPNITDIFLIGSDGLVYTGSLLPGDTTYNGYWNIPGFKASPCYPISAVSRTTDRLDIFAIGTNSQIYQASWEPDFTLGWQGWTAVPGFRVHGGAKYVTAISRSENVIDLFAVGTNNQVWTSGWLPESGWGTWRSIPGISVPTNGSIAAVSREEDFLDIFTVDTNGYIWTAAWQPGDTSWAGWWTVAEGRTSSGGSVSAVSRSADHIDVFTVGTDDNVYTAAWQPGFNGFQGWWPVGGPRAFDPNTPITSISRAPDVLSVFALAPGTDDRIWWSSWSPSLGSWTTWATFDTYYGAKGAKMGAVSMAPDRIDIFGASSDFLDFRGVVTWEIDSWINKNELSPWCAQSNIMTLPVKGCPYY